MGKYKILFECKKLKEIIYKYTLSISWFLLHYNQLILRELRILLLKFYLDSCFSLHKMLYLLQTQLQGNSISFTLVESSEKTIISLLNYFANLLIAKVKRFILIWNIALLNEL